MIKWTIKIAVIFLLLLVTGISCEKKTCKDCYRIDSGGIIPATKIRVCGEESINQLQSKGYLCKD